MCTYKSIKQANNLLKRQQGINPQQEGRDIFAPRKQNTISSELNVRLTSTQAVNSSLLIVKFWIFMLCGGHVLVTVKVASSIFVNQHNATNIK